MGNGLAVAWPGVPSRLSSRFWTARLALLFCRQRMGCLCTLILLRSRNQDPDQAVDEASPVLNSMEAPTNSRVSERFVDDACTDAMHPKWYLRAIAGALTFIQCRGHRWPSSVSQARDASGACARLLDEAVPTKRRLFGFRLWCLRNCNLDSAFSTKLLL